MALVLRVVRGARAGRRAAGRPAAARPRRRAAAATQRRRRPVDALLADAATVGEYLSVTTGRVLGNIAESRHEVSEGRAPIDVLDAHDRRPRRVRRAVEREHGARPGVALRRHRPPRRAGARRARARRLVPARASRCRRTSASPTRRRRPVGAGGPAGGQREPRRLPPAPPQRRRAGGGGRAAAARRRQPAVVRRVDAAGSPTTSRPSSGARVGGPCATMTAMLDGDDPLDARRQGRTRPSRRSGGSSSTRGSPRR